MCGRSVISLYQALARSVKLSFRIGPSLLWNRSSEFASIELALEPIVRIRFDRAYFGTDRQNSFRSSSYWPPEVKTFFLFRPKAEIDRLSVWTVSVTRAIKKFFLFWPQAEIDRFCHPSLLWNRSSEFVSIELALEPIVRIRFDRAGFGTYRQNSFRSSLLLTDRQNHSTNGELVA